MAAARAVAVATAGGSVLCLLRRAELPCGRPPLVLLGGTAQTIASFVGHHAHLARRRDLVHYEARGQGAATTLPLDDCGLEAHVRDLDELLRALRPALASSSSAGHGGGGGSGGAVVDLCGFSFGGRVALAAAAMLPGRVGRLVVSGTCLLQPARWTARAARGEPRPLLLLAVAGRCGGCLPDRLAAEPLRFRSDRLAAAATTATVSPARPPCRLPPVRLAAFDPKWFDPRWVPKVQPPRWPVRLRLQSTVRWLWPGPGVSVVERRARSIFLLVRKVI